MVVSSKKLSKCLSPMPNTYEQALREANDLAKPPLQVKNASGPGAMANRCLRRVSVGTEAQHSANTSSTYSKHRYGKIMYCETIAFLALSIMHGGGNGICCGLGLVYDDDMP